MGKAGLTASNTELTGSISSPTMRRPDPEHHRPPRPVVQFRFNARTGPRARLSGRQETVFESDPVGNLTVLHPRPADP